MGGLITLLIILLIAPISLAGFLPNRYTRTGEELFGKNLLSAHALAHLTRGIRGRKSRPIRWPGRLRQKPTNSTRPVTAKGPGLFLTAPPGLPGSIRSLP